MQYIVTLSDDTDANGDDNDDNDDDDDNDNDDGDEDGHEQEDEVSPVPSLSVEPLAGGVLPCNANILTPILWSGLYTSALYTFPPLQANIRTPVPC